MHPWLSWIRWLNPFFYMLESIMANEVHGADYECSPPQLAPFGPGYEGAPAACAITGSQFGSTIVAGDAYLGAALAFSKNHVWRNWGITMAWWTFYIILGCLAVELVPAAGTSKGVMLYKRGGIPGGSSRSEEHGDKVQSEKERNEM
jgi:ABC-type multidrug transport system permease subunit